MDNLKVWGHLGYFIDLANIHPDDLSIVEYAKKNDANRFYRSIYYSDDYNKLSEYIKVVDFFGSFRVKRQNFILINKIPQLTFEDLVLIKKKPEKTRKIVKISFHNHSHKDNIVYYTDVSNGDYGRFYWFFDELEKL